MPLKITRSTDPLTVSQITVCIYAQPGVGRTSTAFTTNTLLLDFDKGAYRSGFRKDSVQIESWKDVDGITPEDMAPYDVISVDTVGRGLDFLSRDIIAKDAKNGRGSGDLTLQGYGVLKARFASWLKHLHSLGKDVVLLAHMDEQRKGDEVIERLDIQGSSRQEVYKSSDAMARLYMEGGKRRLNFNPGDAAFGKNPAMLPVYDVPDFNKEPLFLAGIIDTIKERLNAATSTMMMEQARVETLRDAYSKLEGVEAFNLKAAEIAGAEPKIKALLVSVAEKKGLKLDRSVNPARFVAPVNAAPAATMTTGEQLFSAPTSTAGAAPAGAPNTEATPRPASKLEQMITEGQRVLGISDDEMKQIRTLCGNDSVKVYNKLNELAFKS